MICSPTTDPSTINIASSDPNDRDMDEPVCEDEFRSPAVEECIDEEKVQKIGSGDFSSNDWDCRIIFGGEMHGLSMTEGEFGLSKVGVTTRNVLVVFMDLSSLKSDASLKFSSSLS